MLRELFFRKILRKEIHVRKKMESSDTPYENYLSDFKKHDEELDGSQASF